MTEQQLEDWGVRYTDLQVGNKPHFDMYICDKSYNSESYFQRLGQGLPYRITGGRECRSRDTPSAIDALSCINKKEPKFEREETQ